MIIQLVIIMISIIINIYVIYKLYQIIINIYILKDKLNKYNCFIIYNRPECTYMNKILLMIFEYICNNYIFDINNHEEIIKKFSNNNNNNINIIYHTIGGDISSNDILINYIIESKIKINGFVFKHSQSAGTLLALLSTNLYINKDAILSPTDPQITIDTETYSIKSIINMCETKEHNYISDKYLLQYYENKKLHYENIDLVTRLINNKIKKNISYEIKKNIINELTSGDYSHHKPISGLYLNKYININLNISQNINNIYEIFMVIYPLFF